jgi:hypothetical protein
MVSVIFIGAADAQFEQSFPVNGEWISISMSIYTSLLFLHKLLTRIANPLSISHIQSTTAGVTCVFNGIDQSLTTVSDGLVDVGPPQTQVSGSCSM